MRSILVNPFLLLLVLLIGCQKEDPIVKNKQENENDPVINHQIVPTDFLSDDKFDKLIVEIQYVSGYEPTAKSLDNLKTFLQQRLNKPEGISIVQNSISSPGKSAYSLEEIRAIEKANRTQQADGSTLTAYFFFADGDYAANSGNSKVLGIAYGASSMVLFEKTIREFSGGITQPSATTLETTVINHEFGHVLGLVNNGTSMQDAHQDEAHGKHCNNKDCLMYYTVATSEIVSNIIGGNIPELDAGCINDLRANGGK
jgi:predicted Zn-dependent protease